MGTANIIWSTTVQYLRGSSIAGLSHAANAKSFIRIAYWLGLFLGGLYLTLQGLYLIIEDAYQYPIVTSTRLATRTSVPFPAVTICNINRINCVNIINQVAHLREEGDDAAADNLKELSDNTGCTSQICSKLGGKLEEVQTRVLVDPSADAAPFTMAQMGCHKFNDVKVYTNYACYYLYQMWQYPLDEDAINLSAEAGAVWAASECNLTETCEFVELTLDLELEEQEEEEELDTGEEIINDCVSLAGADEEDMKGRRKRSPAPDQETSSSQYLSETSFMSQFMEQPEEVRRRIGHLFSATEGGTTSFHTPGMFKKCSFKGEDCMTTSLWYETNLANFGNCYTFNAANNYEDREAPRNVSLTGSTNSLEVELFLDQHNYMSGALTEKAGIRIAVHNAYVYPLVDDFGLDVEPGTATSIAIQLDQMQRLPHPYPSKCFEFWTQTDLNSTLMVPDKPKYSKTVCNRFCIQEMVMQQCDCFHPQMDLSLVDVNKFHFRNRKRPCNLHSGDDHQCVRIIMDAHDRNDSFCSSCHMSCSSSVYSSTMMTSLWPSNRYWRTLALEMGFHESIVFGDQLTAQSLREKIQLNYLKVQVYYQTLNVRENREMKKYTLQGTVAAVGGSLSLYLGVALILCFELVELIVDIVLITVMGSKKKEKKAAPLRS